MKDFISAANPCPILPDAIALSPEEVQGFNFAHNLATNGLNDMEYFRPVYWPVYGLLAWGAAHVFTNAVSSGIYKAWTKNDAAQQAAPPKSFIRRNTERALWFIIHPTNAVDAVFAYGNYVISKPIYDNGDDLTSFFRPAAKYFLNATKHIAGSDDAHFGMRSFFHNWIVPITHPEGGIGDGLVNGVRKGMKKVVDGVCFMARTAQPGPTRLNDQTGIVELLPGHNPRILANGEAYANNIHWHADKIQNITEACKSAWANPYGTAKSALKATCETLGKQYEHYAPKAWEAAKNGFWNCWDAAKSAVCQTASQLTTDAAKSVYEYHQDHPNAIMIGALAAGTAGAGLLFGYNGKHAGKAKLLGISAIAGAGASIYLKQMGEELANNPRP